MTGFPPPAARPEPPAPDTPEPTGSGAALPPPSAAPASDASASPAPEPAVAPVAAAASWGSLPPPGVTPAPGPALSPPGAALAPPPIVAALPPLTFAAPPALETAVVEPAVREPAVVESAVVEPAVAESAVSDTARPPLDLWASDPALPTTPEPQPAQTWPPTGGSLLSDRPPLFGTAPLHDTAPLQDTAPWGSLSDPAPGSDPLTRGDPAGVDDTAGFDDTWGGEPIDDGRSEIEALIARAEADAAAHSGSGPLTFTQPDGVDLAAIVATQPQEPPRPVYDAVASSPDGPSDPGSAMRESPDWLTDLVGSIGDGSADGLDADGRPVAANETAFVHANSVIAAPKKRINGFAVGALVASCLWVCGLGSLVGIVFAVMALVQISTVHQRGRVMAFVGLVLGVVGFTAALVLFVFNGSEDAADPVLSTPPALGEVTVSSCAINPNGTATAIVRIVNSLDTPIRYEVTVAFQTAAERAVETATPPDIAPGENDTVTVVTEATFSEVPMCKIQDVVRSEAGG